MRDIAISPEQMQDPQGKNVGLSRDPARTPMQWSAAPHGGFSAVAPWLPLSPDYPDRNVVRQEQDPDSVLSLYRRLIQLRRDDPCLVIGAYRPLVAEGNLIAYLREHDGRRVLVALNLGPAPGQLGLGSLAPGGQIIIATERRRENERVTDRVVLAGDDGVVVRLD
jgi:alpha-glucosidase